MTVTAEQLIAPRGRIPASYFPELERAELEEQLTAYIADGETRVTAVDPAQQDEAVTRWAEYRAFDAAYVEAINTPLDSSTDDVGSRSFTLAQLERIKALATAAKLAFDALVPLPVSDDVQPPGVVSVPTRVSW